MATAIRVEPIIEPAESKLEGNQYLSEDLSWEGSEEAENLLDMWREGSKEKVVETLMDELNQSLGVSEAVYIATKYMKTEEQREFSKALIDYVQEHLNDGESNDTPEDKAETPEDVEEVPAEPVEDEALGESSTHFLFKRKAQ